MEDTSTKPRERQLRLGSKVEVRNRFERSWQGGFVIESLESDGVRLRRLSDKSVLPAVFSPDEVRRQRTRSTWWS